MHLNPLSQLPRKTAPPDEAAPKSTYRGAEGPAFSFRAARFLTDVILNAVKNLRFLEPPPPWVPHPFAQLAKGWETTLLNPPDVILGKAKDLRFALGRRLNSTLFNMPAIIRAISIKQPFVEQILRGAKRYEYRSMPTNVRERIYLYASLTPRKDKEAWRGIDKLPSQLPKGLIVGSVEIVGCKQHRYGYAYKLANPKRLRIPLKPINQPSPRFWRPQF